MLGRRLKLFAFFTVENQEITREILSTKVEKSLPRIVEKGTKKAVAPSETPQSARKGEPETQASLPEYKGEQSGVVVVPETAKKPSYTGTQSGAIVEPEQVAPQPEYKGIQSGAIVEPETADKPSYTGTQSGAVVEPEKVAPQPEYKGTQAGAIVEPEIQPSLPEYKGEQSDAIVAPEKTDKPSYTGTQSGAIVEPEKVAPLPEYQGTQAGAIVEPETHTSLPEYKGEQSGAIVAPETNEKPEYTGIQSGAIVEPETADKPSYTGTQSGAVVEPEQVAPQPEYKGLKLVPSSNRRLSLPCQNILAFNLELSSNQNRYHRNHLIQVPNPERLLNPNKLPLFQNILAILSKQKPENPSEKLKEKDPEKTLELRNVSDLELYSQTNGTYKQHVSLDSVPSNLDTYFVKVKSSSFKDVYLPVASITAEIKNGQSVYKIIAKAEKLQQELENKYVDNFTFYLAKKATEETTTFTSFSNLVKAINKNLSGTYHLAASLNANEVELGPDDRSYIKGTFTGQLIGEKDGKHYAIYNLKKPLF